MPMSKNLKREKGPSHPQRKPDGPFEAISWMPHKQCYLRTRHEDRKKAERRLRGNSRHTQHQIIDHTPQEAKTLPVKKEKIKPFLIGE